MFGSTSTFGSTAPTFGATSFTNPSNPFGAGQQPGGGSLFGASTAFNAPKPAGFGTSTFGSPQQSTSLFGQQNRLGGTATMFNNTTAVGSPFGGVGVPQAQGTSVQFTAITGSDTMMKNGVASPINTRHQCITCMKEYEQKSLEELRYEDYQLGRKGNAQQQNTMFGSAQAQPTGLFSSIAPAASTSNAFGQRPPAFGAVAPQPTTTGGLFSNLGQQQKPSFFGSTPATNTFGGTTTGFGGFPTSQPQQQQSLFGQTNPATSTVGMGTTSGFTFGAAQPMQQPQQLGLGVGPFGQKPMGAPGVTSAPAFGFGTQTNAMSKPSTLFNTTTPTFSTGFGGTTAAPATNMFSTTASKPFNFGAPASSGSFTFPNPATSTAAPAFGIGSSGFGAQTTTTPSTSFPSFSTPFASNPTGFSTLGNTSFGAPASTGFSFGNSFAQPSLFQPAAAPSTGPVPFATTPYQDSPWFYNLTTMTNRNLETMTKPTNPLAQRAMKEASRRRSSTALGSSSVGQGLSLKQMTFPVSKTPSLNKSSVFDGFEEEDHGPTVDILSPKTSVKKLSLKTLRGMHRLSLPLSVNRSPSNDETVPLGSVSLNDCGNTTSPLEISEINRTSDEENSNSRDGTNDVTAQNCSSERLSRDREPEPELEGVRRLSPEPTEILRPQQTGPGNIKFHDHNSDTYVPLTRQEWQQVADGNKVNQSGVICTTPGYYVQPSVAELDLYTDNDGKCFIRGFCVGRHNYGQVRFLDVVNVAGLNIDEIVKFRHKEVVVYPDEETSPPVGQGLNVPAQVHLARVWPFNKKTRDHIKDPETIRALKYEDLLRRSCERMDVDFVSYDPEEGVWVFTVKHFSKYSCVPEEEDEDEEVCPPMTKISAKGLGGLTSAQIKLNCPQVSFRNEPYEPEEEPSLLIQEPPYRTFQGLDSKISLTTLNESKLQNVSLDTSRTILGNIFFPEDTMPDNQGRTERRLMSMDIDRMDTTGYETLYDTTDIYDDKQEFYTDKDLSFSKNFAVFGIKIRGKLSDISPQQNVKKAPTVWSRRRDEIQRKTVSAPFKMFSKLWTDPSSVHIPPRSARMSMGPKGQFVQILNNPTTSTLVQFNGEVVMKTLDSRVKQMDKILVKNYKDILGAQLDLYLENCKRLEDTFSLTNSDIVSVHVEKLSALLGNSSFSSALGSYLTTSLKEEREVWKLLEILTGNGNGFMGSKNQKIEMKQRDRLGKWLRLNSSMLFSKLFDPDDTSVKGYLLRGMKQEASRQAIREKNYTLALCLVQNNQHTQSQVRSQLDFWNQEGAVPFVDPQLLELYGLCAGFPIWREVDFNRMTTSEWLQHFATFVWYLTPAHLTIDKIVCYFQQTVRGTAPVISDTFSAPAVEMADSSLSNLCVHLLKMYSSVGYPIHKLLSPKSHSPDVFDYKVSWFLLHAFLMLGIQIDDALIESITIGFAQQLEMLSMWEWSVFILKFLPPTEARRITIRRLLERHLTLAYRTLPGAEFRNKMLVLERIGVTYEELKDCKY